MDVWAYILYIDANQDQYRPGRNYYKIIPWNNNFCNFFVIITN